MSFVSPKSFSVATDEDRKDRGKALDREHYQWFRDYLNPIATLRNPKLGDGTRDIGSPTKQDPNEEPPNLASMLLSPEQIRALEKIEAEHGEDALLHPEEY